VPGKTFFLPAYWWYSIKFNDPNTAVSMFNYRTYMNNVAISPYFALHALQLQNVKRTIVKTNKMDIVEPTIIEDPIVEDHPVKEGSVCHDANIVKNTTNIETSTNVLD
jgi:hypothetical protein